jgi:hypothetical protein
MISAAVKFAAINALSLALLAILAMWFRKCVPRPINRLAGLVISSPTTHRYTD